MKTQTVKKLARVKIGVIPGHRVMPSKKDYNRKSEKQIPRGDE